MKINNSLKLNRTLQTRKMASQKREEIKDQVTLGENSYDLNLMKKPLGSMKSSKWDSEKALDVAHGVLGVGAFAGLASAIGAGLKANGGLASIAATGAIIGGFAGLVAMGNEETPGISALIGGLTAAGVTGLIALGAYYPVGTIAIGGVMGGIAGAKGR